MHVKGANIFQPSPIKTNPFIKDHISHHVILQICEVIFYQLLCSIVDVFTFWKVGFFGKRLLQLLVYGFISFFTLSFRKVSARKFGYAFPCKFINALTERFVFCWFWIITLGSNANKVTQFFLGFDLKADG